jgi:hypothetical protein
MPTLSMMAYDPKRVKKIRNFWFSHLGNISGFSNKTSNVRWTSEIISELWPEQFWFKLSAILNILYDMRRKTVGKNKLSILKTVVAIVSRDGVQNENPTFQFRNTVKEAENWFSDYIVRHLEKKLYDFSKEAKFQKMLFPRMFVIILN